MWKEEYIKKIIKFSDNKLLIEYDNVFSGYGDWQGELTPIDQDMLLLMSKQIDKREIKPLHLMTDQEYKEFEKSLK